MFPRGRRRTDWRQNELADGAPAVGRKTKRTSFAPRAPFMPRFTRRPWAFKREALDHTADLLRGQPGNRHVGGRGCEIGAFDFRQKVEVLGSNVPAWRYIHSDDISLTQWFAIMFSSNSPGAQTKAKPM